MNRNPERITRLEMAVTEIVKQIASIRRTSANISDVADKLGQVKARFEVDEARASSEAQALEMLSDRVAALERRGFWRRVLRALGLRLGRECE